MTVNKLILTFIHVCRSNPKIPFSFRGGFTMFFVVKLGFEIAVVQQTKDHDQTLRGFQVPTGACGTATPLFGQFWLNFAISP